MNVLIIVIIMIYIYMNLMVYVKIIVNMEHFTMKLILLKNVNVKMKNVIHVQILK